MAKVKRHDYSMAFTPAELEEFIEDFIYISQREIEEKGTGTALFIQGDRGVGKSTLVRKVAEKLGYALVIEFVGHLESATELAGLTAIDKTEDGTLVTTRTMGKLLERIKKELDKGVEGVILFLDEINHAPPSVQKALMALILDRRLGDYELPKNVVIIAAGNFSDESPSMVEFMGVPLLSRMVKVMVKSTAEDFLNYAEKVKIHPAILAFVKQHPDKYNQNFDVMDTTYDTSPRTLEKLSEALSAMEEKNRKVNVKKISAYVGPEVSGPIYMYYSTMHASPIMRQLDAVMNRDFGAKPFYPVYPEEFYLEIKTYIENLVKKSSGSENQDEKAVPFVVPFMLAQTFYNQIIPTRQTKDPSKSQIENKLSVFLRGMKASLALIEALTHASKDKSSTAQSITESLKASITSISANISTVLRNSRALLDNEGLVDAVKLGNLLGKAAYSRNFSLVVQELGNSLDNTIQLGRQYIKETCLIAALSYAASAKESKDPDVAKYYREVLEKNNEVMSRVAEFLSYVADSKSASPSL